MVPARHNRRLSAAAPGASLLPANHSFSRCLMLSAGWRRELCTLLAVVAPHPQDAVEATGDDCLPVATGRRGVHIFAGPAEVALVVAVGGVDQPDLRVAAAGEHQVVAGEADAGHFLRELILHGPKLVARSRVPNL